MNQGYMHLLVNHLPIIVPFVGMIILFVGLFRRNTTIQNIANWVILLGCASAALAMGTGEAAEEVVENIAGVAENAIHTHEEAAEIFAVSSYLTAAIALIALILFYLRRTFSKIWSIILLCAVIITMSLAYSAGRTGGQIRHTEFSSGAVPAKAQGEHDDND